MPNARPACHRYSALALGLVLATGLSQDADAAKKKAQPAVTACTDFYTFTNKDWLAANVIVQGTGAVSALGQLRDLAQQQQRDLLDSAMQAPENHVQKLLGDFWASGLDVAAVEADGAQPIAPLLSRIDSIRRDKDIPPAIAALHQVGIPVLFQFTPDVDLADLDRHIGYFTQGGLGLTDPTYYTRADPDTQALLGRYKDYVEKILVLTGTPPPQISAGGAPLVAPGRHPGVFPVHARRGPVRPGPPHRLLHPGRTRPDRSHLLHPRRSRHPGPARPLQGLRGEDPGAHRHPGRQGRGAGAEGDRHRDAHRQCLQADVADARPAQQLRAGRVGHARQVVPAPAAR